MLFSYISSLIKYDLKYSCSSFIWVKIVNISLSACLSSFDLVLNFNSVWNLLYCYLWLAFFQYWIYFSLAISSMSFLIKDIDICFWAEFIVSVFVFLTSSLAALSANSLPEIKLWLNIQWICTFLPWSFNSSRFYLIFLCTAVSVLSFCKFWIADWLSVKIQKFFLCVLSMVIISIVWEIVKISAFVIFCVYSMKWLSVNIFSLYMQ